MAFASAFDRVFREPEAREPGRLFVQFGIGQRGFGGRDGNAVGRGRRPLRELLQERAMRRNGLGTRAKPRAFFVVEQRDRVERRVQRVEASQDVAQVPRDMLQIVQREDRRPARQHDLVARAMPDLDQQVVVRRRPGFVKPVEADGHVGRAGFPLAMLINILPIMAELFSAVFTDFHLFDRIIGPDQKNTRIELAQKYLETLKLADKIEIHGKTYSTTKALSTGQRKRLALLCAYNQYFKLSDRVIRLDSGRIFSDTAMNDVRSAVAG